MGAEKLFENQLKRWLRELGVYPLGTPSDRMRVPSIGYYEKRWGGGYSKAGLPDMRIVINGLNIDVELKSSDGRPSELQKHNIRQINNSGSIAMILYPEGFDQFKIIVKGVIDCRTHIQALSALKAANASTSCVILSD